MKTCIVCGRMFTNCFPRGAAKTCGTKCSRIRRKKLVEQHNVRVKARRDVRRLLRLRK